MGQEGHNIWFAFVVAFVFLVLGILALDSRHDHLELRVRKLELEVRR